MSVFVCNNCKKDYQQESRKPLSLSCGHVFCEQCVSTFDIYKGTGSGLGSENYEKCDKLEKNENLQSMTIIRCPTDNKHMKVDLKKIPFCLQILINLPSKRKSSEVDEHSLTCLRHPGKKVKYFCKTHNVFPCSKCVVDHMSAGHELENFEGSKDRIQTEIKEMKKKFDFSQSRLKELENFNQSLERLTVDYFNREFTKIEENFEKIILIINNKKKRVLEEIKSSYCEQKKKIEDEKIKIGDLIQSFEGVKSNFKILLGDENFLSERRNMLSNCGNYEEFYKIKLNLMNNINSLNISMKLNLNLNLEDVKANNNGNFNNLGNSENSNNLQNFNTPLEFANFNISERFSTLENSDLLGGIKYKDFKNLEDLENSLLAKETKFSQKNFNKQNAKDNLNLPLRDFTHHTQNDVTPTKSRVKRINTSASYSRIDLTNISNTNSNTTILGEKMENIFQDNLLNDNEKKRDKVLLKSPKKLHEKEKANSASKFMKKQENSFTTSLGNNANNNHLLTEITLGDNLLVVSSPKITTKDNNGYAKAGLNTNLNTHLKEKCLSSKINKFEPVLNKLNRNEKIILPGAKNSGKSLIMVNKGGNTGTHNVNNSKLGENTISNNTVITTTPNTGSNKNLNLNLNLNLNIGENLPQSNLILSTSGANGTAITTATLEKRSIPLSTGNKGENKKIIFNNVPLNSYNTNAVEREKDKNDKATNVQAKACVLSPNKSIAHLHNAGNIAQSANKRENSSNAKKEKDVVNNTHCQIVNVANSNKHKPKKISNNIGTNNSKAGVKNNKSKACMSKAEMKINNLSF
jgi:hypothetical protein